MDGGHNFRAPGPSKLMPCRTHTMWRFQGSLGSAPWHPAPISRLPGVEIWRTTRSGVGLSQSLKTGDEAVGFPPQKIPVSQTTV